MRAQQLHTTTALLGSDEEADVQLIVHEARKAIKRLRTLDTLIAQGRARGERRAARANLRQAAQSLAGTRDAQVCSSTLEALLESEHDLAALDWVRRFQARLRAERAEAELATQARSARREALSPLLCVQAAGPPSAPTDEQVGAAFVEIYRQARRAMKCALRTEADADLHRWRKRVKDLRHALEALTVSDGSRPAAGSKNLRISKAGKKAAELGEVLGEAHDLEVLAEKVRAQARDAAATLLLAAIEKRKAALRRSAFEIGGRLLAEKPGEFAERRLRKRGGAQPS